MITAIILILLITGSVVFHFLSPWWWTPIASNWGGIDDTIILTFWITGAVNVAIVLFMAYCLIRYRHKKGRKAAYEPENTKLEWTLTIVTSIGVVAMLAPGSAGLARFHRSPGRGHRSRGDGAAMAVGFPLSG